MDSKGWYQGYDRYNHINYNMVKPIDYSMFGSKNNTYINSLMKNNGKPDSSIMSNINQYNRFNGNISISHQRSNQHNQMRSRNISNQYNNYLNILNTNQNSMTKPISKNVSIMKNKPKSININDELKLLKDELLIKNEKISKEISSLKEKVIKTSTLDEKLTSMEQEIKNFSEKFKKNHVILPISTTEEANIDKILA